MDVGTMINNSIFFGWTDKYSCFLSLPCQSLIYVWSNIVTGKFINMSYFFSPNFFSISAKINVHEFLNNKNILNWSFKKKPFRVITNCNNLLSNILIKKYSKKLGSPTENLFHLHFLLFSSLFLQKIAAKFNNL